MWVTLPNNMYTQCQPTSLYQHGNSVQVMVHIGDFIVNATDFLAKKGVMVPGNWGRETGDENATFLARDRILCFGKKALASIAPYTPINVKPAGGGGGGGGAYGGILTFSQKLLSNSLSPGKNVRSNILKFPTPGNDLWSQARTKIKISLRPGQQDNTNALPPGQSDRKFFPNKFFINA